ncbi:NACHT domain- and WD repeat-containing protein 1-like [Montipora capricornis]|uniref:NACHT domain- and WD repeat-containing protein 1-like n=1 Tax=Montipora capricornis TaxID=246305 RepID=UPI0035F17603
MGIVVSRKRIEHKETGTVNGTGIETGDNDGAEIETERGAVETLEEQQQFIDEREGSKNPSSDNDTEGNSEEEDGSEVDSVEEKEQKEKDYLREEENSQEDERDGTEDDEEDDHKERITLDVLGNYSEKLQKALMGDLGDDFPENVKVVRIFTSSTFTDTSVERNTLMERVYPRLKSYCQERGYDFQVVDMRWGVRDESTDDHMTTELCMRELRACQELSTGPNFITFLGQKYGYRPFPAKIDASEFEKLLGAVGNEEDRGVLTKWFWRDDNAVPAQYLLQPITSLLPHYRDYENNELRKKASADWWKAFERMQIVLRRAADKVLDKESARHKYHMSVTEDEIRRGIINAACPSKHCFWFKRVISDLVENIDGNDAGKFIDKTWGANPSIDETAQKLLNNLREKDLPQSLPSENIITYEVNWSENGVDPTTVPEHSEYIERLCKDFYDTLTKMIDSEIKEKETSDTRDSFAEEVFQHGSFCQQKCRSFHGRSEFLDIAKKTVMEPERQSLVLYGESGCGKTSVMAKIATEVKQWLGDQIAIVVLRFIGTSSDSSSIRPLLTSICIQLCKVTGQDTADIPEDMKSLKDYFPECLEKSAENNPVVLVLDSLDQLSIDDGGRQMEWFPRNVPSNVYFVLSTLPGHEYQALPSLRTILPDECFLEIPRIPLNEAGVIFDNWMKAANRTVLSKQKSYVMDAFQKCPLPLYLKLAFDEALRWNSYTPDSDIYVEQTVREIIDDLFERLERRHGKLLVSNALGYITASKNGLTETELEDLLSLDDDVLNDVYQYWTPPIRRLPPLLWIRIRSDIGDYLIERGADGTQVVFWYHRQFIEAARARYLKHEEAKKIHANMSEYFLGKWSSGTKKPFTDKEGKEISMDRLVAKQPLMFDANEDKHLYNLRKLSELPFHLFLSGNLQQMKDDCLCNFEFLLAKVRGASLQDLMGDFSSYLEARPEDDDVQLLQECLQLSANSLSKDSRQLPTQIIGRMYSFLQRKEQYPDVYRVLEQAFNCSIDCFLPNRKCLTAPGGALRSTIGLTQSGVDFISMAKDNRTIVVTSQSSEGFVIRIIDYRNGRELRKFTIQEPTEMYSTNFNQISQKDPDLLILAGSPKIFLLNTLTGQIIQEFQVSNDDWFSYEPQAPVSFAQDENLLVALCPEALKIWEVGNGKLQHNLPLKDVNTDEELGSLDARGNYAVFNIRGKNTVHFVDVKIGKELDRITVKFPKKSGESIFIKEVKITSLDQVVVIPSSLDNLRLYDLSGNLVRELVNFKMQQGMERLQVTDDGKRVVTVDDFEICILNLETGETERCLRNPIVHSRIYTRDGKNILAVGQDDILRVYDKSREEEDENANDTTLSQIQGHTIADQIIAISPSFDQRHVVTTVLTQLKNEIHVWDIHKGKRVRRLMNLTVLPNPLRMCTATRGVGYMHDRVIPHYKVFNLKEGKIERNLDGKACERMDAFGFIDQKHMISFSRGRRNVKIWDIDSGRVVKVAKFKEKRRFEDMVISSNGKMVVCSQVSQMTQHTDKELHLIAIDTTSFTHKFLNLKETQLSLFNAKISDDGEYLVNLVEYSQPLLWNLLTGELICKLFNAEAYESASVVAVSASSMTAMTAVSDVGIKIWDVKSGQNVRTISCPDCASEVYCSPDGKAIISRSQSENTFDAWDMRTTKHLASFTTDGYANHVKIIGNRIALGLGENPNLMVLRLHRPKTCGDEEGNEASPYDGLSMEVTFGDFQEKPSAKDGKDDDDCQIL